MPGCEVVRLRSGSFFLFEFLLCCRVVSCRVVGIVVLVLMGAALGFF